MILRVVCFFLVFVTIYCVHTTDDQNESLKFVHVFVRHGARYPQRSEIYPKDPYKFSTNDLGQLNKLGKVNSHKVGKFLKKRYGSFLGDNFQHDIVRATSTSLSRTKMTALLVLAGLFPPTTTERWSDEIPNWQPVPYDYLDGRDDTWLLRPSNYCPKYKKELEKVQNSPAINDLLHQHAETLEYMKNHTGKNYDTLESIFRLNQLFSSEASLHLALPQWTSQIFPHFVLNLTLQRYILENSNVELIKLSGGRMLSKVTDHWKQHIDHDMYPSHTKMLIFAVHEHNLVNLMFALGIFDYQFPNYSSAIIFELHYTKKTREYAARILHLADVDKPPIVKNLKDCDDMCPLKEFLHKLDKVLPKNYTTECESERALDRPEWRPSHHKKHKL